MTELCMDEVAVGWGSRGSGSPAPGGERKGSRVRSAGRSHGYWVRLVPGLKPNHSNSYNPIFCVFHILSKFKQIPVFGRSR